MGLTRGSLTLPRMNAHRIVIIAAALTVVVATALATALSVFSDQALPRAVHHDLSNATGTTLALSGTVTASQAAQYTSAAAGPDRIGPGRNPFAFYHAVLVRSARLRARRAARHAAQRGQPAHRRGRRARRRHRPGGAGFRALADRARQRSADPGGPAGRGRRAAARDRRRRAADAGPDIAEPCPVRHHRPVPAQAGDIGATGAWTTSRWPARARPAATPPTAR